MLIACDIPLLLYGMYSAVLGGHDMIATQAATHAVLPVLACTWSIKSRRSSFFIAHGDASEQSRQAEDEGLVHQRRSFKAGSV